MDKSKKDKKLKGAIQRPLADSKPNNIQHNGNNGEDSGGGGVGTIKHYDDGNAIGDRSVVNTGNGAEGGVHDSGDDVGYP